MTEKKTTTVETPNFLNQVVDLVNEMTRTYYKSVIWSQERALEFTKELVKQAETYQAQGRGLVEEYGNEVSKGGEIVRDAWQQVTRNGSDALKDAQDATANNIQEVSEKVANSAKAAAAKN